MVKNSFISIILKEQEENKENRGSVEFQVVSFTNKIRRLTSHLDCTKKTIYLREVCGKFLENVNGCWLICQKKNRVRYEELIGQLDIRERKTR